MTYDWLNYIHVRFIFILYIVSPNSIIYKQDFLRTKVKVISIYTFRIHFIKCQVTLPYFTSVRIVLSSVWYTNSSQFSTTFLSKFSSVQTSSVDLLLWRYFSQFLGLLLEYGTAFGNQFGSNVASSSQAGTWHLRNVN